MKKIIASVLSFAIVSSYMSIGVYAEAASAKYTIDIESKIISEVAPLTKVSDFKANITDAVVEVVNVDGSVMEDTAYATENVFAKIDGVLYGIETKALYQPIKNKGETLADGTELYNMTADSLTGDVINNTFGFNRLGKFGKFGTGSDVAPPANTADQTIKATKTTYAGKAVYRIENDSNQYAYMRTHAGYKTTTDTALRQATETQAYAVTSYTFKADKPGNISVFHNMPTFDGNKTCTNYDTPMSSLLGSQRVKYAGNALHFTEDGKIKVGGNYENYSVSARTPYFTVGDWNAGEEYNVSIVQKSNTKTREHRVVGIFINGKKVFPASEHTGDGNGLAYQSDGTYRMYGYSSPYYPGISSIFFATAPKTAGENLTVDLSDFKVYGLASAADFDAASTKQSISLSNAENVTVTENEPSITDSVAETVSQLKAKYPDVILGVYNKDGVMVSDSDYLETGMTAKIASKDGLQGKTYTITATKPLSDTVPESGVYTVDTEAKTISGVAPLTTVSAFLANFDNGSLMKVVNIDGSEMEQTAYATENVSLMAPNGELYKINVKYAYAPLRDSGSGLADGTEIYNAAANAIPKEDLTNGGFTKVQTYAKIGYGSDNAAPANTEAQTVKATKQTENGETVYVMENDSNNYAYLRSHYSESLNYSTVLNSAIDSWSKAPIVTTVEFEADKYGTVSIFNNTPVRDGNKSITKGDSAVDGLIYSVEMQYAPSSVHFMEDGSVKLGGIYSNYSAAYRNPVQETDFRWEPGRKYTVSIVQRYFRGAREAYVDGVYVNGTKIFPNEKTVGHYDDRVALQSDGTFKIGTKNSAVTHGGGLSSVMIGTAPKTADENMKVSLSDVKVYGISAYNPAVDADIILNSTNNTVKIDNDKAVIKCTAAVTAQDFDTTARLRIDADTVKAVSADGLASKTYRIETESIQKGFYNGENGPEIKTLAEAGDSICFMVDIDEASVIDGETPAVILAVYNKSNELIGITFATGTKYTNERTKYKAVADITKFDKANIRVRGFVWSGFSTFKPLTELTELK